MHRDFNTSFRDQIVGQSSVFNDKDYSTKLEEELASNSCLPVVYRWNSESKLIRAAKIVASIIIFPVGICYLIHLLACNIIVQSSLTPTTDATESRVVNCNYHTSECSAKRIAIEVDGCKIDVMILRNHKDKQAKRWTLFSQGNWNLYEDTFHDYRRLLQKTDSNGLFFNYSGVGASCGMPTRDMLVKTYRAALTFLENDREGLGASEIVGYGHSLGGGVQGEALLHHQLKQGIKYVFVKNQSFSNLSTTAAKIVGKTAGFFISILVWNLDSVKSSKQLAAREIIVQTASVNRACILKDSATIIDDDVIHPGASLAKALMDDPTCPKENKVFIGTELMHNDSPAEGNTFNLLANEINKALR